MTPSSKVHGTNMGPTCGRQDPGGPHVGHVNLAIWDKMCIKKTLLKWNELTIQQKFMTVIR